MKNVSKNESSYIVNEKVYKLTENVFNLENDVYANAQYYTFNDIDILMSYCDVLKELAMCYNLLDAPLRVQRIKDRLYRELESRF